MQYMRGQDDSIVLYDRSANVVGEHHWNSGQEIQEYFDALDAEIFAYNGQRVYFEPSEEIDLTTYVVIP